MKQVTVVLGAGLLLFGSIAAAVPRIINLQGLLRDGGGTPVTNGSYFVTFRIYSASSGGSAIWSDTQTVATSGGLFNAVLGAGTPVPDSVFNDSVRYLGIQVFPDGEMMPRQRLTTNGYSFRSAEWTTSGNDLFRVNGNVGIGTTTPSTKLEVNTSGHAILGVAANNGGEDIAVEGRASGSSGELIGLLGTATGANGAGYGVIARSTTGGTNYGVFGSAFGGTTNWAAYFPSGNVFMNENVGIGTTSPTTKLEVNTSGHAILGVAANSGGEDIAVEGRASGSSGELIGLLGTATGANGAGYGVIARSTTGGTNYGVFASAFGGTTNWAGYFPSGNIYITDRVGLGTTSPAARIHVKGAGFPQAFAFFDTDANGQDAGIRFYELGVVKSHLYHQAATNTLNLYGEGFSGLSVTSIGRVGIGTTAPAALLHVNGTAGNNTGVWSNLSDRRLKKDIAPLTGALETVTQLQPVTFRWKDAAKDEQFGRVRGLIAQEVEQVVPEWIRTDADGYKRIEPIGMDALLMQAIRELDQKTRTIEDLERRVEDLEGLVRALAAEAPVRGALATGR